MKINIFKNTVNDDDVNTIKYLLNNIKWESLESEITIKTYRHESANIEFSDLNIHIDLISPIALNLSNYNLFIPNILQYNTNQNYYLDKIDQILYRTHDDMETFKNRFMINIPNNKHKYLGWVSPERINRELGFSPKNTISIYTIMHSENKLEVIELAKIWNYTKPLKIYTSLKNDNCILDVIGLNNIELLFDFSKICIDNSCYIIIGIPIMNIILENMCYGNTIFYDRKSADHEYLYENNCFIEYNMDTIYDCIDRLKIVENSNYVRKTFIDFTNKFIKNFSKIFNIIFKNLEPYEPILNELTSELPIISLISQDKTVLLQRWFDHLDYPKDKLEWLISPNIDDVIDTVKGEYVMIFDKKYYYNPQCIKNRLIIMRDKECVFCAIKPNYDYIRKISSMIIEPITKKMKERIINGSLFFKPKFWKSDWDFNKTLEINWLGVYIGIDIDLDIKSEPNGCHFNIDGGMDLDTIEYLNMFRDTDYNL